MEGGEGRTTGTNARKEFGWRRTLFSRFASCTTFSRVMQEKRREGSQAWESRQPMIVTLSCWYCFRWWYWISAFPLTVYLVSYEVDNASAPASHVFRRRSSSIKPDEEAGRREREKGDWKKLLKELLLPASSSAPGKGIDCSSSWCDARRERERKRVKEAKSGAIQSLILC